MAQVDNDTIVGGEQGDIIFGGFNADLIETGEGDDLIFSSFGNDTVDAGGGDDSIFSGFGNDSIDAGEGNDFVFSSFGDDTIDGGEGDDLIFSSFGDDQINGGDGNDAIFSGFGNDSIDAGDGADFVDAGKGDDFVFGGAGVDILNGGDGDDTVDGGKGDDIMNGGDGNDRLIWNNGDGSDILDGGDGYDVSEVNDAEAAGDEFVLGQNGDRALFERVNLGQFTLDADNVEAFEINASGGDDSLTVNDLSDTDVEVVNFSGGEGNDVLDGSETDTTLIADGGIGDDLLQGGNAADTLDGGAGNDTILGGGGVDELNGGDGDDIIDGQKGDDIMNGGAGNDRLIWNNGDGSDILDGGDGYDISEVNDADGAGDEFVLGQNGDRALFERVNLGQFTLDADNVEAFEINASGGDDSLTVNDLSDTDVEQVNFSGGEGNDVLDGRETDTTLVADGGVGDDLLLGGNAADTLDGGAGDDIIVGGGGADELNGGDGDDRFIWNNGDGSDILDGGDGFDVSQVNGADGAGDEFVLGQNGDRALFERVNLGQFTLDADNVESFEINASGGDDSLFVNDLSDTDVQSVIFSGGEGNDFLNASGTSTPIVADGGAGDDILIGGAGDDILIGGAGADLLIGGAGNDILIGGEGADFFGFDSNAAFDLNDMGTNQIQGFQSGEDQIILDKTVFAELSSGVGDGFDIANEFAVVANEAEADASEAAILFNSSTGALIYNQNGTEAGYGDGGQFAVLEGVENLSAEDFAIRE